MKRVFLSLTSTALMFNTILSSLHREQELRELCQWARRKKLERPYLSYHHQLLDEIVLQNRYALRYPYHSQWAKFLYFINRLVTPRPKYYPRGAAAKYRRNNLTTQLKESYSF